ncbi:MAG: hypothetical protein HYU98_00425 [Deltaproteobacteria bacterium]|nr:hypothetical protein [Deltaproteobacteria bacterium]
MRINRIIFMVSEIFFLMPVLLFVSCAHPLYEAREFPNKTVSKTFETDANQAYSAIRWALKTSGYAIINENLEEGIVTSGWLPTKADSHYLEPFGHPDYGVNGAYYRLEVKIIPEDVGSKTRVEIVSRVRSMMAQLKSSEIEEKKILNMVSDYLRKPDIHLTNIGLEE